MTANSSRPPSLELAQALASYLPRHQLRLIVQGVHSGFEPFVENCFGTILLVDVSGFTGLTERFAARGFDGAEQLSGILNGYFGQIADIITSWGGDIIAFAGDSALAMWPGEESDWVGNALRCTCAALAIQSKLDRYEPVHGIQLRQRAGIGCGQLQLMELGGLAGHWQFVVTGDPVTQASIAAQQAQPGEVLLSSRAWNVVKEHLQGSVLPSGLVKATETPDIKSPPSQLVETLSPTQILESFSALSQHVPIVVADRLGAGQEQWISEFRTLSMLFLGLAPSKLESGAAVASLHQDLQCIQKTLERYEGTLYQFLMDDKGLTAVCAFGLPPLAHENDPRRAIEAGIALRHELASRDVWTSGGIATGTVFCGVYGSTNRRQYTALGSTINLAARLMQSARGSLFCDESTARAALSTSDLCFEPKDEIRVKGRADPIPVYVPSHRAVALTGSPAANPVFQSDLMVGREAERAAMTEALTALVERGESRCLIVEGEAGVGKSCLLEHLSQKIRQNTGQKIACWRAAADPIQQSNPYHLWRAVFHEVLQLNGIPVQERRDHVFAQLAIQPDLLLLAPLLNAVLPLGIPENATTAAMEGQARAENTEHLLINLLQMATSHLPMVIVLEDAQWFDSSSLRLVLLATQRVSPLFLVLSTRPFAEPCPAEFATLLALPWSSRLTLGPLDFDLALQMVCRQLGVSRLPPEVARFIHERAGGHPLFAQQLAYALRDAGVIVISEGKCQIAESADDATFDSRVLAMRLPSTVEGVITSRLDRMPSAQQLTVKVASVLGQKFQFSIFCEIYPGETDHAQLSSHLNQIEKLDLVHCLNGSDPVYVFKHAVIQEVAYNSISFALRHELHRSVAEWYENTFHSDLPAQYPLLAHHWSRAEVASKATHYCSEAGAQALRNYANPEAVRFLSEALRLEEKETQGQNVLPQSAAMRRAEWELQLGQAYVNWSKYVEGRTHIERGLSLQRQGVPDGMILTAGALFREIARQCLHRSLPAHYLGRSHASRNWLLKSSRSFEALTEIYFLQNKSLPCLHAVFCSLNLAELAGASPELARGYSSVGSLLGFMTLHRAANAYFTLAGKTSGEINDPASCAWVMLARAVYEIGVGQWDAAASLLNKSMAMSDCTGDRRRGDDARTMLVLVRILQGGFRESLALSNLLYNSAKERLNVRIQAEALYGKAWNLWMLDHRKELAACLEELDSLRSAQLKIGGRHQKQDVDSLSALLHLSNNDLPAAKQAVDQVVRTMGRSLICTDILVHSAITEVYLGLWQTAKIHPQVAAFPGFECSQLQEASSKAVKALHGYTRIFPIGKPLLYLRQGQYEWIKGNRTAALRSWEKSLQSAGNLQAAYYQGLAHLELGLHAHINYPGRASHLQEAGEILTRMEAVHNLAHMSTAAATEPT